jgi:hypothetical protein
MLFDADPSVLHSLGKSLISIIQKSQTALSVSRLQSVPQESGVDVGTSTKLIGDCLRNSHEQS